MRCSLEKCQNCARFKFDKENSGRFIHLGIIFEQDPVSKETKLHQGHRISELEKVNLGRLKRKDEEKLTNRETKQFRRVVGSQLWLAQTTRPDILSAVARNSGQQEPTVGQAKAVNKVVRYLKETSEQGLWYRAMDNPDQVIWCYADSSFQSEVRGGSRGGHLIMIGERDAEGKLVKVSLLGWSSGRLRRVVVSTFAGELLQQTAAFDQARWTTLLLKELIGKELPLRMRTDCKSLVDNLHSLRQRVTEWRLMSEMWALREAIEAKEIESLDHVPTTRMIADGLTKPDPKLRNMICRAMEGYLDVADGESQARPRKRTAAESQEEEVALCRRERKREKKERKEERKRNSYRCERETGIMSWFDEIQDCFPEE